MERTIGGVNAFYERAGDTGPRVLLLHGWGCDSTLMAPVADQLKDCCQTLRIDFPGHGRSGRPPEPWGTEEYAAWTEALVRELDFFPCAVVAHSFGGRVAVRLAAARADRFPRMVLTGAAGLRKPPSEEAKKRGEAFQRWKKGARALGKIPGLKGVGQQMENALRRKYGSRDYNALDAEMRQTFVRVVNEDLTELYPKIRASTLLIWGDADTETPLWMGKEMEKLIPDAGLVILEGGSHFAYLEQIQRFNTIARHFLKEDD